MVYFLDASHFVLGSFLGWIWCFARMFVRAASGRQRYNVLGALNAVTHELITVINTTYINAESVCALLRKLAVVGQQVPITLVLDNARYQRCTLVQNLAKELGIELLFLPSYSPNLNLIERLWKFLRKEALQKWHPTFEDMQQAVADVLDNLPQYRTQLDTLMTERFHLTPVASTIIVGVGTATKQVA